MRLGAIAVLLATLGCRAAALSAEVFLKEIRWQLPRKGNGRGRVYETVDRWVQPPAAALGAKPRALVTLVNRGPAPAEGVLLRYAVASHLVKIGKDGDDGVWTVAFWHEELHIPLVKANQSKDVPIDSMSLDIFLRKMFRAGYWPDAIRLHVMIEPRAGEDFAQRILETTFPVKAR